MIQREKRNSHQSDRKKLSLITRPASLSSCLNCGTQRAQGPLQRVVREHYYPQITDEKNRAHESELTSPRPYSLWVAKLGLKPVHLVSQTISIKTDARRWFKENVRGSYINHTGRIRKIWHCLRVPEGKRWPLNGTKWRKWWWFYFDIFRFLHVTLGQKNHLNSLILTTLHTWFSYLMPFVCWSPVSLAYELSEQPVTLAACCPSRPLLYIVLGDFTSGFCRHLLTTETPYHSYGRPYCLILLSSAFSHHL